MVDRVENVLSGIPSLPGVYILKDKDNRVIYVSRADKLKEKLQYHFNSEGKKSKMIQRKTEKIEFEVIHDTYEATSRELELIKKYHPPLNRRGSDEKQYRFIYLTTTEKYPRASVVKTNQVDDNSILGPFPKNRYIKRSFRIAINHFNIADCGENIVCGAETDIIKNCLRRKTKQCCRPCEVEIDAEKYQKRIDKFVDFFTGKDDALVMDLVNKMNQFVEENKFENAAKIRDQIQTIEKVIKFK